MVALLHPEHVPATAGDQPPERPRLRLVDESGSPGAGRSQDDSSIGVGTPGTRSLAGVVVVLGLVLLMLFVMLRVAQGTPPAASWDGLAASAYRSGDTGAAVAGPTAADQVHVVEPGDTLWALALELDPAADPRPIVDALAERNGGPALQVGQRLVIPAALLAD